MSRTRMYVIHTACIFIHAGDKLGSSRRQSGLRFRIDPGFKRLIYGTPDGEMLGESHHLCFVRSGQEGIIITTTTTTTDQVAPSSRIRVVINRQLRVSIFPVGRVDV